MEHMTENENTRNRTIADVAQDSLHAVQDSLARNGFSRPGDGKLVGGVFSGIGRRFGLDPWTSRLAISAALLALPGTQVLVAYPVLWALMPQDSAPAPADTPPADTPASDAAAQPA